MKKDFEKTIGNMADKLKTAFIGSVDSDGYPYIEAMLQPRKRDGIRKVIKIGINFSSKTRNISEVITDS